MKIAIISGRYPASNFDSHINHKIYADTHNYTYINCNYPTRARNPYFNKVEYINDFIRFFDFIMWIDDDAFFLNFKKSLDEFMPKNKNFISFCKSPDYKQLKTFISSGQFILKCNEIGQSFINDIQKINIEDVKKNWSDKLGYYTNGDQDAMIHLLLHHKKYQNKFELFNYKKFNSRYENIAILDLHKIFILHFTGTVDVKMKNYTQTQKLLNLPPHLVCSNYLDNYNLKKNNTILKKSFFKKIKSKLKYFSR